MAAALPFTALFSETRPRLIRFVPLTNPPIQERGIAMNRKLLAFAAGFFTLGMLLGAFFIQSVDASPLQGTGAPTVVSYQGLISEGGSPFDGTGYFKFAVVSAAGVKTYWSNDGTSSGGGEPSAGVTLPVNDGYFIALLGDTSLSNMETLPASVFSETECYLRIWFSGDGGSYTLLSPDQPFSAVPYALQAQEAVIATSASDADTLDGVDSSELYTKAEVDVLLAAYDSRITALETKLASVSTENGGDDVVFTGVNVHVRDGSSDTDGAVNGLGNLIVGYNEDVGDDAVRSGSHNLIVGTEHSYTSYGGLVAGQSNTISGPLATVSGGYFNTASGDRSSVSGGYSNTASAVYSSVSGGRLNTASYFSSSVSGGYANTASYYYSSVSGGQDNTASSTSSSVSGGFSNTASEYYSSVSGGQDNTASSTSSSVSGGRYNIASGDYSSVLGGGGDAAGQGNEAWAHYSVIGGGRTNTAGDDAGTDRTVGEASAVLGGSGNTASGYYSSVSGGNNNAASGSYSSVSGGNNNAASGGASSVSGGSTNTASGAYSSVSGGLNRSVSATYDWAAGDLWQEQ